MALIILAITKTNLQVQVAPNSAPFFSIAYKKQLQYLTFVFTQDGFSWTTQSHPSLNKEIPSKMNDTQKWNSNNNLQFYNKNPCKNIQHNKIKF